MIKTNPLYTFQTWLHRWQRSDLASISLFGDYCYKYNYLIES